MQEEEYKLYNEQGKVEDDEVAREMAKIEGVYHKKILWLFSASRNKIKHGEEEAEKKGLDIVHDKNLEVEIKRIEDVKKRIRDFKVGAEYAEMDGGISLGPDRPLRVRDASFVLDGKKWNVQFEISVTGYHIRSVVIDNHKLNSSEMYINHRREYFAILRKFNERVGWRPRVTI